jgi:type VI secretion system secreted protein VgrG
VRRLTRPKYSFTSGALPADTFTVVAFTGQEGVSQLYQFDLTLLADPGLDPQEVLNHAARFTIHRDGGDRVYHGVLSSLELFQAVGGTEWYRARLVPRLWWLGLTRHQQVFLDQTVPSFLEAVLLDGGLTTMDFQFRLRAGYPPVPFVCQYQESHWEFLCRWLEREGICFFFEQQAGFEKVVFSDDRAAHADLGQGQPLEYLPPSGLEDGRETVQAFACQSQVVPDRVLLKDHNYQRPSLELEGQAQVDPQGRGQVYLYGEHFGDTGEGARLATLRKEELLCRRQQYRGAGTAPCVAPGFLVRLARHFRAEFNRSYLVLEVRHQGSQAGALDAALRETMPGTMEVIYRNEFLAIPGDVQFRPPLQTRKPRVAGTLPGWIDGAGDGVHAELDDQGRYKVILPFDRSGRKGGKASIFLRMAQPYAGAEEGMHFPLRKGAEVLLTFIDGDPDRPVIAGALPNAAARSPVSGANQTRNRLLSPHGSEIQIDDDDGREGILMRVPAMDTFIQVGAQPPAAEGGEAPEPFQTGVHIQTGHQV